MSDIQIDDKFIKIIYHQELESILGLTAADRYLLSQDFKGALIARHPQAAQMLDIQECPTQQPPTNNSLRISNRFSRDGEESECPETDPR
jgi:hypothetical protein